jgi:hypothetical protein
MFVPSDPVMPSPFHRYFSQATLHKPKWTRNRAPCRIDGQQAERKIRPADVGPVLVACRRRVLNATLIAGPVEAGGAR